MISLIKIEGDAIEVMREIPDNSVDMTFADSPFNLCSQYSQMTYLFCI